MKTFVQNDSTDGLCMVAIGWGGNWFVCWILLPVGEAGRGFWFRGLLFTPPTIPTLLGIHLRDGRCLPDGRQVVINDTTP